MKWKVIYRAEFFREGDLYVGIVPELDVSSYGELKCAPRAEPPGVLRLEAGKVPAERGAR